MRDLEDFGEFLRDAPIAIDSVDASKLREEILTVAKAFDNNAANEPIRAAREAQVIDENETLRFRVSELEAEKEGKTFLNQDFWAEIITALNEGQGGFERTGELAVDNFLAELEKAILTEGNFSKIEEIYEAAIDSAIEQLNEFRVYGDKNPLLPIAEDLEAVENKITEMRQKESEDLSEIEKKFSAPKDPQG